MNLVKRFDTFIREERLFTAGDTLLLAVSGGVDSVVLCALCFEAGYDFVIAHCNFQLRGAESERDEQFVRELGQRYHKEVLVKRFDTEQYAAERKLSIQVAARELRYTWFEEEAGNRQSIIGSESSVTKRPVTYIATAHHLDDNVETLLMKFLKGTGVAGLHGILPRQGKRVRPLLFARKEELRQFAEQHQLSWVEDSSNAQDKYARNYLRHQVIPVLEQLYPEVVTNLADNITRFREVEVLYRQAIDQHRKKLLEYKGGEVHIPVLKLRQSNPLHTLVYEITKEYGFLPAQTPDIVRLLESASGRYVSSASHRVIRNRNWLIIAPLAAEGTGHIIIEENDERIRFAGGRLQLAVGGLQLGAGNRQSVISNRQSAVGNGQSGPLKDGNNQRPTELPASPLIACIDRKHIHFPLLLRPWKAGDYFYPLGMPKKKKVARFLIDQKLSQTAKERVWVLESQRKIIWVVGMRIDDRFKVTDATKEILKIELTDL